MSPETLHLHAPPSKSVTQRALVLAALAPGRSRIADPLECDDSRHLRRALGDLGVAIAEEPGAWQVDGGRLQPPAGPLHCGEAGTALRFLAPLSLLLEGELVLEGTGRLRQRPVAEMVAALEPLGVEARLPPDGGSLPLTLRRRGEPGGRTTLDASRSSQFLSGLLMVAPRLPAGLELALAGPVVSRPYVELTRRAMAAFGAAVHEHPGGFVVPPAPCRPAAFAVEGDWSGGAFLLAAGFIAGRPVQVANLDPASPQGDRAIAGQLAELRRPRPHRFDLTHTPDLIAPLAAACVFAGAPSVIAGAGHARLKESDRVAVLAAGLRRAGVAVDERPDGLRLEPPPRLRPARLDPRGDHRMAMAFGLLSLRQPALEVADPQCVAKSYPGFWQDLERFR